MKVSKLLLLSLFTVYSSTVLALPALQLGPGDTGDWTATSTEGEYDGWVVNGTSFEVNAYANATSTDGGDGFYAWDTEDSGQFAYLVVAAMPQTEDDTDVFDISISGASLVDSGWGNPPVEDTNSIPGHGIYDTYFEIYEFQFDGPKVEISDQQFGETGTGQGYIETFSIDINSLLNIDGLHFDLFTVGSEFSDSFGAWNTIGDINKKLVTRFAPPSHDVEYVPEPGMIGLLAIGLIGVVVARRKITI